MKDMVPVAVNAGFGWTAAGAWASFAALLGLIIRQVGPWKKQTTDAADKMISAQGRRIDSLEKQMATQARMHFIQTARIEARYAAQRSLDRHKFANSESCLEALLIRLEAGQPAQEAVTLVREMRERQRQEERNESTIIHAAEMAAVMQAEQDLERQAKDGEEVIARYD